MSCSRHGRSKLRCSCGCVMLLCALVALLAITQAAGETCQATYPGFPRTTCDVQETTCTVECPFFNKIVTCDSMASAEPCNEDICNLCTCEPDDDASSVYKEISCAGVLRVWPQGLPLATERIVWRVERSDNVDIGRLTDTFFRPGSRLDDLNLVGVRITQVEPNAFRHLSRLERIQLNSAGLGDFPWEPILRAHPRLRYIEVFGNRLATVDLSLLLLRPSFDELHVHNNDITQVNPLPVGTQHTGIMTLGLRGNLITRVDGLARGMPRLDDVYLGANRFTYLTASMFDPALRSLRLLDLINSAVVHVPWGLLTNIMAISSPGEQLALSMEGSPSTCGSEERIGNRTGTYLHFSCQCQVHYATDEVVTRLHNATHCPLGYRMQCPLEPAVTVRVDQFCDGNADCPRQLDEACKQTGKLYYEDPPNCLHELVGVQPTNSSRLEFDMILNRGVIAGVLTSGENGTEMGKVYGVLNDVHHRDANVAFRVAGYIEDLDTVYRPLPMRAVTFFNTGSRILIHRTGNTNDAVCDTRWTIGGGRPPLDNEWYSFPATLEDTPTLRTLLPTYDQATAGVARAATPTTSPIPVVTTNSSTASPPSSGSTKSTSAGAIVGAVLGVLVVAGAIVAVVMSRRMHRKTNPSNTLGTSDLQQLEQQQRRIQRELQRCNVLLTDLGEGQVYSGIGGNTQSHALTTTTTTNAAAAGADDKTSGLPNVPRTSVELHEKLGRGAFGVAYRATWKDPRGARRIVAVKTFADEHVALDDQASFLVEAQLMGVLRHPCLVAALAICNDDTPRPLLIMEYMQGGNLRDFLRTHVSNYHQQPSWGELVHACICIADGMAYLASRNVVHRDLACRNVLVGASLSEDVKISDYGMARYLSQSDYYRQSFERALPIRWMAPESLEDQVWTSSSDMWTCGITLWEVLTCGKTPFPELQRGEVPRAQHAMTKHMPRAPDCPEQLYQCVLECWKMNPESRPSFDHLLQRLTHVRDVLGASGALQKHGVPVTSTAHETTTTAHTSHITNINTQLGSSTSRLLLSSANSSSNGTTTSTRADDSDSDDDDDNETRL